MLTTLTPPGGAFLTAADAGVRSQLRLEPGEVEDNALLQEMIDAAVDRVEAYLRRRLLTQTVRLTLDGFGSVRGFRAREAVPLPIGPIQSVEAVSHVDDAGAWQTLAPTAYRLVTSCEPHELWPAFGATWPVPKLEPAVVRIDLVVGYGDAAADSPPRVQQAVRTLVAHQWLHREGAAGGLPLAVQDSLASERLWI